MLGQLRMDRRLIYRISVQERRADGVIVPRTSGRLQLKKEATQVLFIFQVRRKMTMTTFFNIFSI